MHQIQHVADLVSSEPTFQCRVEEEASSSNKQIANECYEKNCVVSILQAIAYAFCCQVHEQKICECVDNFCRVLRYYIILQYVS
jgi:hypothetical protein